MKTKLTYKDKRWELTIDGKVFPNEKLLIGNIVMSPYEEPSVEIAVDEVIVEDVNCIEKSEND